MWLCKKFTRMICDQNIYERNSTREVKVSFFFFCFLDTKHERNAFMTRVYPQLREFCKSKGYEFQVVDMRWGVRDESTADHITTALCMQEIKACQELLTGPNFVVC